jgi:hypothetical protein
VKVSGGEKAPSELHVPLKINRGENELDGLERDQEDTFQYLESKKIDERAAKNAKKCSVDPPLVTPSPSEEEEVKYDDNMPKNWFCPHLLCLKMFCGDPVLKPLDNPCSANSEPSSDEDKIKNVERGKKILSRRQ